MITVEAAVALSLSHPHLVTTYKYAIKYCEEGSCDQENQQYPQDQDGPGGQDDHKNERDLHEDGKVVPLVAGSAECWLCMELCNKGTLQVCTPLITLHSPGVYTTRNSSLVLLS